MNQKYRQEFTREQEEEFRDTLAAIRVMAKRLCRKLEARNPGNNSQNNKKQKEIHHYDHF